MMHLFKYKKHTAAFIGISSRQNLGHTLVESPLGGLVQNSHPASLQYHAINKHIAETCSMNTNLYQSGIPIWNTNLEYQSGITNLEYQSGIPIWNTNDKVLMHIFNNHLKVYPNSMITMSLCLQS